MAYSTQPSIRYSNELFKEDLMTLATGIVWKNRTASIDNETKDTQELYRIELFVVANRGMLTWEVIRAFPRVVILNSGLDASLLEMYASDKNDIPEAWRQAVVDEYARALTSKNPLTGRYAYFSKATNEWVTVYEETNNYYRMLMGLPDYAISSDEYVYNTDPRWPTDIPIHEMELLDRLDIEKTGVLKTLIEANPDKPYLKYIGKRSIDFFKARIADRFEILWRDDSQTAALNHDFDDVYEKCRQLVLAVYYNNAMRQTNNLYDSFMAMCILFMTLQQMQSYYLHTDITRDFYDLESLKVLYDAYSVPFYSEIPFEYHKKIVKNINRLISYKGSSQVFFDLFQIFDLGTMNIYHYYLTKRHKADENGKPLYRFIYDENGDVMLDENNRPIYDPSVYEMKFSKVLIGEDPALAIINRSNDVDYGLLTIPDPYWIEDLDLITKLQNAKFNYLETKYIGIQTIFDLMSITFENAYVFRMITDNKELCEAMEFRWTDLGIDCSLFDLFIYLACLYCRLYGYEGVITNRIPALMDTLGYDFENARDILRNKVLSDPILSQRQDIIDLMLDMDMESVDAANRVYNNIQTLRELIMAGYQKATTREEFFAYRDLYETLLVSREVTSVYTNPRTGEIFDNFTDVLANCSPDLMQRYLLVDDEKVIDEMNICIDKLEETLTSMRWLPFSAGVNTSKMIDSLFRILKFFKSAKAELIGYDITYAITLRGTNFFKMLDLVDRIFNNYWDNDEKTFMDFLELAHELSKAKFDAFKMLEQVVRDHETVFWWDYIKYLTDQIMVIHDIIETVFKSESWYIDFVQAASTAAMLKSRQLMNDCVMAEEITWDIFEPRYFGLIKDEIRYLVDRLRDGENVSYCMSLLYNLDFVHSIYTSFYLQKDGRFTSGLKYSDKVMADKFVHHLDPDKHLFEDVYEVTREIYKASDIQKHEDYLEGKYFMQGFDTIDLKDRLARIIALSKIDDQFISITDLLKLIILISRHHDLQLFIDNLYEHVTSQCYSDHWFIDVLNEMREFTKFVDGQFFEDQVMVEEIFYEVFYPHFHERLDDDIAKFTDKFKEVSYENGCKIQLMDLLYLIDDLVTGRVVINLKDSNIYGYNIHMDKFMLAATGKIQNDDKLDFSELFEVLSDVDKPIDKTRFSDKLIEEISGHFDDDQILYSAVIRLIAYYTADDRFSLNDLVKLMLAISTVDDKQHMVDTIKCKLQEYSDQDGTVQADVVNEVILKFGHISEVHGFEDFAKAEIIFDQEWMHVYGTEKVKDKIQSLTDFFKQLDDPDKNRARIADTMVLINGLSKVLAVHETNYSQYFSTVEFKDSFQDKSLNAYRESDPHTLKDIIKLLDAKFKVSKDTLDISDGIWLRSEYYEFDENSLRDHLINIEAILASIDEYTISDILGFMQVLTLIQDNPAGVDRLIKATEKILDTSSGQENVDFMEAIKSVATVSIIAQMDDHMKAETVLFEDTGVPAIDYGKVRDCIYELSDDVTAIDLSAMLYREMLALADELRGKEFGPPVVDISTSIDNFMQEKTRTRLADAKTFGDAIDVITGSKGLTDWWNLHDELSTKYQFNTRDLFTIQDILAYTVAISRFDNDIGFLKDMLALIFTAWTTDDYQPLMDDIITHMDGNFTSRQTNLDCLKKSKFRSYLNDIMTMDDMVTAEEVFFDSFEEADSEMIKDQIKELTDQMREYRAVTFLRQVTVLHLMDAVFSGKVKINTKSSAFTSYMKMTDYIEEKSSSARISSKHFIEDLLARSEEILSARDNAANYDILSNTDQAYLTDRVKFKSMLYRIAATSRILDKEFFSDLITFCRVYSSLSDNSIFTDRLKQFIVGSVYDTSSPDDMIKFVKSMAKFVDTQEFGDGVVSESIIFDDYDPYEIEFVEDIIEHLTDKFSELSKHECHVILTQSLMTLLDSLANEHVHIKANREVVEFTDTLHPKRTKFRVGEVLKLEEVLYEVGKTYNAFDTSLFNDMLRGSYFSRSADTASSTDDLYGKLFGLAADTELSRDELIEKSMRLQNMDHFTFTENEFSYISAYADEDLLKIIDQIRRIINIKYFSTEIILSDVLYGQYLGEYADSQALEDRIRDIYQKYHMDDAIQTLKDMLSRIHDANRITTVQRYLDILRGSFEIRDTDVNRTDDKIREFYIELMSTDIRTISDSVMKSFIRSAARGNQVLKDTIDGTIITKPEDFADFVRDCYESSVNTVEQDMLWCVGKLLRDAQTNNVKELHNYLDELYNIYAEDFGDKWRVEDSLKAGHVEFGGTDEFMASELIRDQKRKAYISEVHALLDTLIVAFYAKMEDLVSFKDFLVPFRVDQMRDDMVTADKLIGIIVGSFNDNQEFLDSIISKYIGSAVDSHYLQDQINRIVFLHEKLGEKFTHLDYFMQNQEKIAAMDTFPMDESLALKSERDFIDDVSKYLDKLKSIYTAYGFDYKQLQDAIAIKKLESQVSTDASSTDTYLVTTGNQGYSSISTSVDDLLGRYASSGDAVLHMNDNIRKSILSLWTNSDSAAAKDELIGIILGRLNENQILLDSITARNLDSLEEFATLKDQIRQITTIHETLKSKLTELDKLVKSEEIARTSDDYIMDEAFALESERSLITVIANYLDELSFIYTAYGFDYRQMKDSFGVKKSEGEISSTSVSADSYQSKTTGQEFSSVASSKDNILQKSSYNETESFYMNDEIKEFIINLWISMDSIPTKDMLLQKKLQSLVSDLGYNLDELESVTTGYGESEGLFGDDIDQSDSSVDGGHDNSVQSDILTGEYEDSIEDNASMKSEIHYTGMSDYTSTDNQKFAEALNSKLTQTSIFDSFKFLLDTTELKNVTIKADDIAEILDELSQKSLDSSVIDYQTFSEILCKIAEKCNIAKKSTIQYILDELFNQRTKFKVNDVLKKYRDMLIFVSIYGVEFASEMTNLEELYKVTVEMLGRSIAMMSKMPMTDIFSILNISPSVIEDENEHPDKLIEGAIVTRPTEDGKYTDGVNVYSVGFGKDIAPLISQLRVISEQLKLLSIAAAVTEVFINTSQHYYARDISGLMSALFTLDQKFPDAMESGQLLADDILGKNQVMIANAIRLKDCLWEFTPSGLRRVN